MKQTILLIDDDIDELFIFNEALNDLHAAIICNFASSLAEGLRLLRSVNPDYIFLDMNMPGTNGFQAISVLKNLDFARDIPIIFYSTAIDDDVKEKALKLGARECIRKTDSIQGLTAVLKNLTNRIVKFK